MRLTTEQTRKALSLVERTLDSAENTTTLTSSLVEAAIRIARLIDDYVTLTWLELEVRTIGSTYEKQDVFWELRQKLGEERARELQRQALEHYIEERKVRAMHDELEEKVEGSSIKDIELKILNGKELLEHDDGDITSYEIRLHNQVLEGILAKIRSRVVRYLTRQQRCLSHIDNADALFDEYRAETDQRLGRLCPEAMVKFSAACGAFMRKTPESEAHALTSCRRLMKTVADALHPPSNQSVLGVDGEHHVVGEENYLNRIVQWVTENCSGTREQAITVDAVKDLHARLTTLNALMSKGVHGDVLREDIRFALVLTYITIGGVLRLHPLPDTLG